MLPIAGPHLIHITGNSVPEGTSQTLTLPWLRDRFVSGFLFFGRSANPAHMGFLRLRIVDETTEEIIFASDLRSGAEGVNAPALALHGFQFSPLPLQRPVAEGDAWTITFTFLAGSGVATMTPNLTLYLAEPYNVRRDAKHASEFLLL